METGKPKSTAQVARPEEAPNRDAAIDARWRAAHETKGGVAHKALWQEGGGRRHGGRRRQAGLTGELKDPFVESERDVLDRQLRVLFHAVAVLRILRAKRDEEIPQ